MKKVKYNSINILINTSFVSTFLLGISKLALGCLVPLRAYLLMHCIDTITIYLKQDKDLYYVVIQIIFVSSTFLLEGILANIEDYTKTFLRIHCEKSVIAKIRNKYIKLEYKYIEDNKFYSKLMRIRENPIERVIGFYDRTLQLISNILRLGGVLFLLFKTGWMIGSSLLFISIPLYLISIRLGRSLYNWWEEHSDLQRRCTYFKDILTSRENASERILFGYGPWVLKKWDSNYKTFSSGQVQSQMRASFFHQTANLANVIFEIVIYLLLMIPLLAGHITLGYVVAVSNSLQNMHFFMQSIGNIISLLNQDLSYFKEVDDFFNLDEISSDTVSNRRKQKIKSIEFRNVTFTYPGQNKPILNNLTLKICGNQSYSIVGKNGAGKSTMVKLLLRLYEPDSGEILINGNSIKSYNKTSYLKDFSTIFQDFSKYYFTILENVHFGNVDSNIDTNLIKSLLQNIGFPNEISLGTTLGKIFDNGVDLSGGQWQKLAIARALYSDSSVLILDEPTAALDPVAEALLYESFMEVMKNKLSIFITHRLGSTKTTDKIIVLYEGSIIEEGNHQELVKLNGVYCEMFNKQKSWYEN